MGWRHRRQQPLEANRIEILLRKAPDQLLELPQQNGGTFGLTSPKSKVNQPAIDRWELAYRFVFRGQIVESVIVNLQENAKLPSGLCYEKPSRVMIEIEEALTHDRQTVREAAKRLWNRIKGRR